jgi:thiol-disulfide isomerase/thioredoxin
MGIRTLLITAVVLVGLAFAFGNAEAGERRPYSPSDFAAAQGDGARILVEITASWCPTCKAQRPIVDSLAAMPENADLVIFEVDFDAQKAAVRGFNARMQSTLIAFRGATETGRSVGDTDPASIAALIESSKGS